MPSPQATFPKQALHNPGRSPVNLISMTTPCQVSADLEGYLGETSSSLIQMAALILDGKAGAPRRSRGAGRRGFGLARASCTNPGSRYLPAGTTWCGTLAKSNHHARCAHARGAVRKPRPVVQATIAVFLPAFLPVTLTRALSGIEGGGTLQVTVPPPDYALVGGTE